MGEEQYVLAEQLLASLSGVANDSDLEAFTFVPEHSWLEKDILRLRGYLHPLILQQLLKALAAQLRP